MGGAHTIDDMAGLALLESPALASICRRHGVTLLRAFGSVMRDDFDPERSDVDFLLELDPTVPSMFDAYFDLKAELETFLGRSVDLVMVTPETNSVVLARALSEAETVYAA